MYRIGIVLAIVAIGAMTVHAQSVIVKGQIISEDKQGLPGAGIRSIKDRSIGTSADENGAFEIRVDRSDTLVVSYISFKQKFVPASFAAHNGVIMLEPAVESITTVEVTAERIIAEEFTIRKIKKLEIYTNPAAKADPILAVNSMPSATTLDESANVSLRGGSPAETGIFLNNVPINDAVRFSQLNGLGTFSIFNTAIVNSVQVYPGNPPLEFGNSTSGLIAIQTDQTIPEKPINTASVSLASLGFLSSRKLSSHSSLTLFSNYQPSAFLTGLNQKSLSNLKKFSSADLGIHFYQQFKNRAVMKVFNYSLTESYKFRYEQPTYDGIFHQRKQRNFTVANFRKQFGKVEFSVNQGISFSKAEYTYGMTDIHIALRDLFSSVNFHRSGKLAEWKTGVSVDRRQSDFNGKFPTFDFAAAAHHPVTTANADEYVIIPEWHGYYKRFLGARWIAGVGVRKNVPINNLLSYTAFQGNIHFNATENFHLNLSGGKYFKYNLAQGNEGATLTECDQFSLDMAYKIKTFESSISVFHRDGNTGEQTFNIKGLEAFTKFRVRQNLQTQISFTTLIADEMRGDVTTPSPYDIHYFVRGSVEYKIQGTWTITSIFLMRQGSYYQPVSSTLFHDNLQAYEPVFSDEAQRLPQYKTVDLSVSKIFPFTKNSTAIAFFSSGNIFNFKNVRTYTYNNDYTTQKEYLFSQRTLYFGLILNF